MRQLVTKYQPPGVINKAGEIFVDEVTGQIKIGNGSAVNGVVVDSINTFTPQQFDIMAGRTDGVNDDTSAMIATINAAIAVGDGVINLGNGTYRCTTPIGTLINRPIKIVGNGAIIIMDASLVGDLISFSNTWYGSDVTTLLSGAAGLGTSATAATWPSRSSRRNGVKLSGFRIVGDRRTTQVQNGIVFYDRNDNVLISDLEIDFVKGYGLVLSGIPSNKVANAASVIRESHIRNVHVRWCGDHTTARPALVFNSTDKGSTSFDDACNYCVMTDLKIMFHDGVGLQTNCYNLNSNSHSNNRIQCVLDSPQNVSGASVSGSVASITNGVLTLGAGTYIGTFSVGQYLNNASVPLGTYIVSQLTGTAGVAGTYQLGNRTTDISALTVASGGNMATLRSNIPLMQIGGGHASENWDVVLNASNTLNSGACGVEFNHNSIHAQTAKTVNSTLDITNGSMDLALMLTVIHSLAIRWKLRGASTSITALNITASVVVDLLERAGTDPAISGAVTNLHVRLGGQDVVSSTEFAGMPASKFPNCLVWVKNGSVYTRNVSDGTSWLTT